MSVSPVFFPWKELVPTSTVFRVMGYGAVGSDSETLGGNRQTITLGSSGTWVGRYENIPVFHGRPYLALRSFLGKLRGRHNTFLAPTRDSANIDASGLTLPATRRLAYAAANTDDYVYVEDWAKGTIPTGLRFSAIGTGRMYEVVESIRVDRKTDYDIIKLDVWPRIREAMPAQQCLDFCDPSVEVRLTNYDDLSDILDRGHVANVTMEMLEK